MHLQSSWYSLQLTQHLLFKNVMLLLIWCLSMHLTQCWFFLQNLIMWSNSWHLKHCVMQQFFLNSLHVHSWYAFSILTFISWFIIASIAIFMMSNEWVFSLFATFLNQTILKIFRFLWSFALFFYQLSNDFLLIAYVDCSVHLMCQHCKCSLQYARQIHNFFCSFLSLFQICSCIWTDCMKKDVFATQLAKKHDQISLIHWHICYFLKNLFNDLLLHLLYFFSVCYLYHDFTFLAKWQWLFSEMLLSRW